MRLVEMEKANKDYIRDHIDACFEEAEESDNMWAGLRGGGWNDWKHIEGFMRS